MHNTEAWSYWAPIAENHIRHHSWGHLKLKNRQRCYTQIDILYIFTPGQVALSGGIRLTAYTAKHHVARASQTERLLISPQLNAKCHIDTQMQWAEKGFSFSLQPQRVLYYFTTVEIFHTACLTVTQFKGNLSLVRSLCFHLWHQLALMLTVWTYTPSSGC